MDITIKLQSEYLHGNIIEIFSNQASDFGEVGENKHFRGILFSNKKYSWTYVDAVLPDGKIIEGAFIVIQEEK